MTTPALQRLRERFPQARLTLVAPAKLAGLWQQHPGLDAVVTPGHGESPRSVGRQLRGQGFDLALILPNSPRAALEAWWARIPQRIGYASPWRSWLLTTAVASRPGHVPTRRRPVREIRRLNRARLARPPEPPEAHQIHDYLHLAAVVGADPAPLAPRLEVSPAEIERTAHVFLADWVEPTATPATMRPIWFGLNPGAEYGPAKRWPAANFAAVLREVSRRGGPSRWLLFGGPNDWRLCHEVAERSGGTVLNLAGRTSLRELMALLKLCRVLLTNDTGPMHLAAALGTRVVVPFGSTSPGLTGPGLPGDPAHRLLVSDTPCAPCFRRRCPIDFRCMTGLGVPDVVEAVLEAAEFGRIGPL